jgi:hypothetical protein
MKLKTGLAIPMMAVMSARAGKAERRDAQRVEQKVIVYVENAASVPNPVLFRARTLAAEMFAVVGVRIDWRAGERAESQLLQEQAIAVRLTLNTPKKFKPGGVAFAFPYGESHITVLYDRLAWSEQRPGLAPALLAHVLVHEITHKLQGIYRHSRAGIMKSNWTEDDYYDMQTKTLPFASEDVELIQLGLAQRQARAGKVVNDPMLSRRAR